MIKKFLRVHACTALTFALACGPRTLGAQLPVAPAADTTRAAGDTTRLVPVPARDTVRALPRETQWLPIGTPAEDRLRTDQLLGRAPSAGFLIRSVSSYDAPRGFQVLRPHLRAVWNSYLPVSANDGLAWTGRGLGLYAAGGVRATFGRVTVIAAPEMAYAANHTFQRIPYSGTDGRSPFANPFHGPRSSLDAPLRFGDERVTDFSLGQSSVTVRAGSFAGGFATENLWWGPGIRNALVMSNNAPGFPHLFVRTSREGVLTPLGTVHARWVAGALSQSDYFNGGDEGRTIAALALSFTPRGEPGLTLGATRAVYRTGDAWGAPLRFFDVLLPVRRVDPTVAPPAFLLAAPSSENAAGGSDQLFALFGRWVFPESGFEMYGEWARQRGFGSLREILTTPDATRGYTVGLQWITPGERTARVRLQTELTTLEQNDAVRNLPQRSFYTSPTVPQGYTHRGQVLGASIGPGSSSQWAAADYLRDRWRVGVFASRTRWDEDALVSIRTRSARGHDVQVATGARAALRAGGWEVSGELSGGRRLNWLFQNEARTLDDFTSVDVNFSSFILSVSPAFR